MTRRPRVLLIDDDSLSLRLLETLMTDACGADVDAFPNPLHALDRARGTAYDLVVTDLRMPELTGTELAAQFRLLQPTIPVILITGEMLRSESSELFFATLVKPLDREHLIRTIRAALDTVAI